MQVLIFFKQYYNHNGFFFNFIILFYLVSWEYFFFDVQNKFKFPDGITKNITDGNVSFTEFIQFEKQVALDFLNKNGLNGQHNDALREQLHKTATWYFNRHIS